MSAAWPVHAAAVARWMGWPALAALIGDRIYDGRAPAGAIKPYIVIDSPTEVPQGTLGTAGSMNTLTAHAWSGYDGSKEVLAMVAEMDAALAEPLAVEGRKATRLKYEFMTVLVEGDSRHAPVRYRILSFEQ